MYISKNCNLALYSTDATLDDILAKQDYGIEYDHNYKLIDWCKANPNKLAVGKLI